MFIALPSYNPPLSDVTNRDLDPEIAPPEKFSALDPAIARYVNESLSANTRKAYLSDLAQFELWGGQIPAAPETVAAYLVDQAERLAPASLVRHIASIAKSHRGRGFPTPTSSELVKAVTAGIRRSHGRPQAAAKPLLLADLIHILSGLGNRMKDDRDKALLLVGFSGGFRRSELAGLDVADVEKVRQGIVLTIKKSKTDQLGHGRRIGIPFGRTHCPVMALEQWLERSGIATGAIFRAVDRHGHIADSRLTGDAVCRIVQAMVGGAGISNVGYSGHSLRAGFATSAAQAGVSSWKIRQQTGHASDAMLARYVRDGELFVNNAAGALL
jgi:integrase